MTIVENNTRASNRKQPPPPRLYYPSIFRYTCRGALGLSSQDVGSAGNCRGLQSRLDHVRDMHLSTRDEATQAFCSVSTIEPQSEVQQPQNDAVEKLAGLLQTQALIYKDDENENTAALEQDDDWHEWSCYGSTEVHLLVLRDAKSQKETIAGVAPECRLGVSVRDVGNPTDGGGVVASVRAGPFEINLVGDYYHDEEKEDTQQENAAVSTDKDREEEEEHLAPAPRRRETMYAERFTKASQKLLKSMANNATFLHTELSDNFPTRTYHAGERVVGQFGKTMDRTRSLMASVYKMWRDDGNDEDGHGQ